MKPSKIASKLRQIAANIDKSKNPRRDLVAADLKRVIARVVCANGDISQYRSAVEQAVRAALSAGSGPQNGVTPGGEVTIDIGNGPSLFPGVDNLYESSWFMRLDVGSHELSVNGSYKRDVETLYSTSGPANVQEIVDAILEDAAGTISMVD